MPKLEVPGVPLTPPIFCMSVNPIPIGGGQIIPNYYYWPPKKFSPSGITDIDMFKFEDLKNLWSEKIDFNWLQQSSRLLQML